MFLIEYATSTDKLRIPSADICFAPVTPARQPKLAHSMASYPVPWARPGKTSLTYIKQRERNCRLQLQLPPFLRGLTAPRHASGTSELPSKPYRPHVFIIAQKPWGSLGFAERARGLVDGKDMDAACKKLLVPLAGLSKTYKKPGKKHRRGAWGKVSYLLENFV